MCFFPSKVFSTSTVARKKTTAVATLRSVATEPVELRPQPTLAKKQRAACEPVTKMACVCGGKENGMVGLVDWAHLWSPPGHLMSYRSIFPTAAAAGPANVG